MWGVTKKKNLTLALDEELIVKARVVAARRRTSLTSLVRQKIEELVAGDQLQARARARLKSRMRNPVMEVGKMRWTRDELHDRSRLS
ncbi:MAG: hypothetical protein FJW35_08105 [Acidobacteria bacterium]|nr:hypothetical protein [Acidobacteriota bacterium]